jgi:tetratricopeptide (TPR) repeat protein
MAKTAKAPVPTKPTVPKWTAFPHASKDFAYAGDALKKGWDKLHQGDAEPFPKDAGAREAWRLFHQGRFAEAVAQGLEAGGAGLTAANKAQAIYANGVEPRDASKVTLFEEVMQRAAAQAKADPGNANAHYLYAYAAGRYSQRISVAKALAQGYGGKIRNALEAALKLAPKHAEAHIAMGAYHAEIIDKVGALVGGLTYGAKKEKGEEHYQRALELAPASPIACIEYANGLVMMHGKKMVEEAGRLYARAAQMKPRDAMERLDVEMAKAELA